MNTRLNVGLVFCLGALVWSSHCPAIGDPSDITVSSSSLEISQKLPDGETLKVQREYISYPFTLQGQTKTATATLYFLEFGKASGERPTRVWEGAYWRDFHSGPGRPMGFALGIAEGRTSGVALGFWEGHFLRFVEVNLQRRLKQSFEDDVRRIAGKKVQSRDFTPRDRTKPDPSRVDFRTILPTYFWDAGSANPPKITKIWHDTDGWNMTIAATKPEMHLLLRDRAKEWVWVNKPPEK